MIPFKLIGQQWWVLLRHEIEEIKHYSDRGVTHLVEKDTREDGIDTSTEGLKPKYISQNQTKTLPIDTDSDNADIRIKQLKFMI